MALDERERLELRQGLVEVLGPTNGNRLMDQVPPFDWADVAMKSDLVALEERLELRFDRIDQRFEMVEHRFERIDQRFEMVEHRFERIDQRFEMVEHRFEMIEPMIAGKFAKHQRELYVALMGMLLAMASITAAVVGIVLAVAL